MAGTDPSMTDSAGWDTLDGRFRWAESLSVERVMVTPAAITQARLGPHVVEKWKVRMTSPAAEAQPQCAFEVMIPRRSRRQTRPLLSSFRSN